MILQLRGLLVLALVAVAVPVSASASASDQLGVSWDGRHWSGELRGSLFDPSVRWVPGDVRSNSFHVRNQAGDTGTLTVAVDITDQDRLLRIGELRITARVGEGDWAAMEQAGDDFRLGETELRPSESRKVQVRARFEPASTNRSQDDHLALSFLVTLTDAKADPGDDDHDDDGPGGPDRSGDPDDDGLLPDTGAPVVGWLVVLAGIVTGTGLALIRRRKREASAHEQ